MPSAGLHAWAWVWLLAGGLLVPRHRGGCLGDDAISSVPRGAG